MRFSLRTVAVAGSLALFALAGCASSNDELDPGEHVPQHRLGAADDLGWSVHASQQAAVDAHHVAVPTGDH